MSLSLIWELNSLG